MPRLAFFVLTAAFATVYASPSTEDTTKYCGGTIREPGILKSPPPLKRRVWLDGDIELVQEMNCVWHIEAPKDKKVVFKITQTRLDRPLQNECGDRNDYIAVFDGLVADPDERLAVICSRRNSSIVLSSTQNALTVQFKTDNFGENDGFNSEIIFSYPESVGCGGNINLTTTTNYILEPPQVTSQEGDILDCKWNFKAPEGMAIKVSFSSFKIKCQNDYGLEIRDGNGPDSLLMGSYCGNNLPPVILSSVDQISIRLSSDIESHFIAILTVQEKSCSSSMTSANTEYVNSIINLKYPGDGDVPLAQGIHCSAELRSSNKYALILVRIKNLYIEPGFAAGKCDKDKLIIGTRSFYKDNVGYLIENKDMYYQVRKVASFWNYDGKIFAARQYELCGSHQNLDFYFRGPVLLNLITTPELVPKTNKTVEIEVIYEPSCEERIYTAPYGRVLINSFKSGPCSTLIRAPEGYTISVYVINFEYTHASDKLFLNMYDGNTTNSELLNSTKDWPGWPFHKLSPVMSTGRQLLLQSFGYTTLFDAVYMITNKGRGCGGYIYADIGVVTSPFYPDTYKEAKSCEWEIETPAGTGLHLQFPVFDLGDDCDNNFVQLLNREGKVLSTICAERPHAFTSEENYLKIVFVTTASNEGKGWHALFGSAS